MDEETTTRRFSRACQRETDAVLRLFHEDEQKPLNNQDRDRLLFWCDAWEKAVQKYWPNT